MKQGDKKAFEELYDNYSGALYGVIFRVVKSEEVAADVLQATFVKIWSKIAQYDRKKSTIFTWMLNIARNTAIDQYRKTKRENESPIQKLDNSVSNVESDSLDIKTNSIGLTEVIAELNPDYQLVVEYLYFKGYTQQELSDELSIPLGTVKTRARNALIELRKIVGT